MKTTDISPLVSASLGIPCVDRFNGAAGWEARHVGREHQPSAGGRGGDRGALAQLIPALFSDRLAFLNRHKVNQHISLCCLQVFQRTFVHEFVCAHEIPAGAKRHVRQTELTLPICKTEKNLKQFKCIGATQLNIFELNISVVYSFCQSLNRMWFYFVFVFLVVYSKTLLNSSARRSRETVKVTQSRAARKDFTLYNN